MKIGSSVLQRDKDRVQKNGWVCLFKLEKQTETGERGRKGIQKSMIFIHEKVAYTMET